MGKTVWYLLIVVLIAGAAWGYRYARRAGTDPVCPGCNIVIVSFDTLSATHMPCYGYSRNTMPNLCGLARRSYLFPNAFANAQYTLPAYGSLFTGLYPETHALYREDQDTKLPESAPFLPYILKTNGYRTLFVMPEDNAHMPTDRLFYRGIDVRLDGDEDRWDRAFEEFRTSVADGNRSFLFIHSYAAHPPYRELSRPLLYTDQWYDWIMMRQYDPDGVSVLFLQYLVKALGLAIQNGEYDGRPEYSRYLSRLERAGSWQERRAAAMTDLRILDEFRDRYDPLLLRNASDPGHRMFFEAAYDQGLHDIDSQLIPKLERFMAEPAIRDSTVFVILSNHGEDFGQHGFFDHSSLYESNVRIPFMLSLPGNKFGRISTPVETADVVPTLLELVGIRDRYAFDGVSVAGVFRGLPVRNRLLLADRYTERTIRDGKWKLFLRKTATGFVPTELYDTDADPNETRNILVSRLDRARAMIAAFNAQRTARTSP